MKETYRCQVDAEEKKKEEIMEEEAAEKEADKEEVIKELEETEDKADDW